MVWILGFGFRVDDLVWDLGRGVLGLDFQLLAMLTDQKGSDYV